MKPSILAALSAATYAIAQNTSTPTNTSQLTIQSSNNYTDASLAGYHVGAALSYMVASSPGTGNSFTYNTTATSAQLLNNDIADGYPLPCYIVVTAEISNNSGPLECGASDQQGDYDNVSVTGQDATDPGQVTFSGISAWFVCAVQSFTYGWVDNTVVGLYGGGDEPAGPGVENCTAIDGLVLVGENGTVTTSTATDSASMAMSTSAGSMSTAGSPQTVTVTTPCSSQTASSNATLVSPLMSTTMPTATSPVAPFMGAANTFEVSFVLGVVCAALTLLL